MQNSPASGFNAMSRMRRGPRVPAIRNHERQMAESFVRGGAVPMLNIRRNTDGLSRFKLLRLFALKLVVATPSDRNENLGRVMVDMPVVPASRFERHIVD